MKKLRRRRFHSAMEEVNTGKKNFLGIERTRRCTYEEFYEMIGKFIQEIGEENLVALNEEDEYPYTHVNVWYWGDEEKEKAQRLQALDELTALSQVLGLYK